MKTVIAVVASLLFMGCAHAEQLSWFWRTDNYRVPLPSSHLAGYVLIYERINIHDGEVDMANRVAGVPQFKTLEACSLAQMGRLSKPDAQGFVRGLLLPRDLQMAGGDGGAMTQEGAVFQWLADYVAMMEANLGVISESKVPGLYASVVERIVDIRGYLKEHGITITGVTQTLASTRESQ